MNPKPFQQEALDPDIRDYDLVRLLLKKKNEKVRGCSGLKRHGPTFMPNFVKTSQYVGGTDMIIHG
jgi:hypothetical protein